MADGQSAEYIARYITEPAVRGPIQSQHSRIRYGKAIYTTTGAEAITETVRFMRLPKNASMVRGYLYATEAIAGATDVDLGLAEPGVGGAVIDADLFVNGLSLATLFLKDVGIGIEPGGGNSAQTPSVFQGHTLEDLITDAGGTPPAGVDEYDVLLTWISEPTEPAASGVIFEIFYTAGD